MVSVNSQHLALDHVLESALTLYGVFNYSSARESDIRGLYEKQFVCSDRLFVFAMVLSNIQPASAAEVRRPAEWDKTLEAAKKEGKIVIAIPPANELRKDLETVLKQKFGLEAELVSAPGPRNASRIASERKAGVSYFDALIVGTGTAVGLAHDGMLELHRVLSNSSRG